MSSLSLALNLYTSLSKAKALKFAVFMGPEGQLSEQLFLLEDVS